MKIWYQHGSEHSANLVMIGHFADANGAKEAKEIIDALMEQAARDLDAGTLVLGSSAERYEEEMLDLLRRLNVASIGPAELEQFIYEADVELEGRKVVITTDELDIAAFLKVLFLRGARVEIYSAHVHPKTGREGGE